jgi:hypothetical protein
MRPGTGNSPAGLISFVGSIKRTTKVILANQRRLLRSLDWGDDDYRGNIFEVVPQILGRRKRGGRTVFENFTVWRTSSERDRRSPGRSPQTRVAGRRRSAKELLETVFKAILDLSGTGKEPGWTGPRQAGQHRPRVGRPGRPGRRAGR